MPEREPRDPRRVFRFHGSSVGIAPCESELCGDCLSQQVCLLRSLNKNGVVRIFEDILISRSRRDGTVSAGSQSEGIGREYRELGRESLTAAAGLTVPRRLRYVSRGGCVLRHVGGLEELLSLRCVLLHPCNALEDVPQVDELTLHTGTASERTWSRRRS